MADKTDTEKPGIGASIIEKLKTIV